MIHLTVQQLSSALDGALGGPSLELVVRHLVRCHECRDRQARLARFDDALRRLLAQDPHEFFMDDLGRRAESIVVAVARGLPVPPMVTSIPLIDEEDPYEAVEPPPATRPELGPAAEIARHAGFGLIGLKPTASRQAPAADPEQAQRMLEALASGDTADFEELTARDLGAPDESQAPAEPEAPSTPDGPTFDLPAWAKEGASRGRATAPGARVVRAIPKLQMMFERLDERAANLSRGAVEEVFRKEQGASAVPASDAPTSSAPAAATSPDPAAGVPSPQVSEPGPAPAPAPGIHGGSGDVFVPLAGLPDAYSQPVIDAYELVDEAHRGPGDDVPFVDERHERRARERSRAARLRARPAGRRSRLPLTVALASVAALAAIVAYLQFSPPGASRAGATAARAPRLPRIEFVGLDSTGSPLPTAVEPDVRMATTPAPVESLVMKTIPPRAPAPADSGAVTPPADTLGRGPGR